jgi:hypothetical protein
MLICCLDRAKVEEMKGELNANLAVQNVHFDGNKICSINIKCITNNTNIKRFKNEEKTRKICLYMEWRPASLYTFSTNS